MLWLEMTGTKRSGWKAEVNFGDNGMGGKAMQKG